MNKENGGLKPALNTTGKYKWVITVLVLLLLAPLVMTSFVVEEYQHRNFIEQMRQQTNLELKLIGALVRKFSFSSDYSNLKHVLTSWCSSHPEIYSFSVAIRDGDELMSYHSPDAECAILSESYSVEVAGKQLIDLKVSKCNTHLETLQRQLFLVLIGLSVFITSALGMALWFVFKKLALRPLQEEVYGRRKAEVELQESYRHLELRVRDRTEELEGVNIRLRQEVEERKHAEMEMDRINRYNELLLKSAGDGLFGIDIEGLISFVNPEATRMLGFNEDELLGRDPHALLHHTKIDGEPYEKKECPIFSSIRKRQEFIANDEVFWRKDGTCFSVEYISNPIVEAETIIGAVIVFRDVTERNSREKERKGLQSQLLHSQKMESVGRLAGGVAHDFNNLLTTIIGYVDLTRFTCGADSDSVIQKNLQVVKSTCEKAAALVRQLLAFSRKQEMEMKPVDLCSLLEDLSKMLRRLIGEDIELTLQCASSSRVFADVSQLEQVFMNLAINARDAMPRGGKLIIETSEVEVDVSLTQAHAAASPGNFIMVTVSDTGEGMSDELQQNIFEPFFTTKEVGKGTGLGLATVFGIIEQHKGIIRVGSMPNQGTTFEVYLPVTDVEFIEVALEKDKRIMPKESVGGSEIILVVDDEKDLCDLVVKTLEQLEYNVFKANSGDEALAAMNSNDEFIDLLLTDMVMPGMNGSELARRLGSTRKRMKVLYMSGYPVEVIEEHGVQPTRGDHFMQKPFTPEQLILRVREILEE